MYSHSHTHTHFFSPLHSLVTEYALCSCSLRELWGAGLLGLWERTWINGLSFIAAWGEQPNTPSRRSYIHHQRAFWKRLQLQLRHVWSGSYKHACLSPHVFAWACGECMYGYAQASTIHTQTRSSSVHPNDSKSNGQYQRPKPWRDIEKGSFRTGN